jgi:hypothetical protein
MNIMPENIYGEIIPDRIDLNSNIEKEYPKQLIITFSLLDTPSLGSVTTLIRNHILECTKSQVNPDIILNFCIDYTDFSTNEKYLMKYIALSEYLLDIQKQIEGLTLAISVRCYFLTCMIPLLYTGIPIKVSEATLIETYSEGLFKTLPGVLEAMIEKLSGKKIDRPFKMDKNIMLEQKLITQ